MILSFRLLSLVVATLKLVSPEPLTLCNLDIVFECTVPDLGGISCDNIPPFEDCSDNDVKVDVLYRIEPCNIGDDDLHIVHLNFTLNGEVVDKTPEDDIFLKPGECLDVFQESIVERCIPNEYCATAEVDAETGGSGGPPCEGEEEIKFSIEVPVFPSPAPMDTCNLDPMLSCTVPEFRGVDCDNIPPIAQKCGGKDPPFEMTFRYNGGDCYQSSNKQPPSLFTCEDFGSIPGNPPEPGTVSYIQAFDLGGGDIYFEGLVPVGELFNLTGDIDISDNMNISSWDPGNIQEPLYVPLSKEQTSQIVQPENLLQTVNYHSSCSRNLFLKDRFGSFQLVQFISEDQGLVTCFVNTMIDIAIQIPILTDGSQVQLLTLFSNTNQFGIVNKTDEVNDQIFNSGDVIMVSPIEATIDLSTKTRYTFQTIITGETVSGGSSCFGQDFYEFTAGNPLPPVFPTLSPAPSPE